MIRIHRVLNGLNAAMLHASTEKPSLCPCRARLFFSSKILPRLEALEALSQDVETARKSVISVTENPPLYIMLIPQ